jgi:hypothetical protein
VYYTQRYKRRQALEGKNKNAPAWVREKIPCRAVPWQAGARCYCTVASAANADRSHVVGVFTASTVSRVFAYCCKNGAVPEPAPAAFLLACAVTDPAAGR